MNKKLKSYLISDPTYYTNNPEQFEKYLINVLEKKSIDIACFRDKQSENFEQLASIFVKVCKDFNIEKILINTDLKLAEKLGANGVHLNSKQFKKIKEAKDLGLYVIISCHNLQDIKKAQELKVNAITYSPIFKTPNKGEAKGIQKFEEVLNLFKNMNIIALGGIINDKQIEQIAKTKAYAFASIRYFV